jgi:hypothetical protein
MSSRWCNVQMLLLLKSAFTLGSQWEPRILHLHMFCAIVNRMKVFCKPLRVLFGPVLGESPKYQCQIYLCHCCNGATSPLSRRRAFILGGLDSTTIRGIDEDMMDID